MNDPKYLIYGLTDPRTEQVRYIGKSTIGMRRPREHGRKGRSNAKCKNWLKSLHAKGLKFGIVVLEVCENEESLNPAECRWIAYGRAENWELTNMTNGGEGTTGHIKSKETREALSRAAKSRQADPEVRENARKKALGHTTSKETREQISKKLKGRKLSASHIENIKNGLKRRIFSEEYKKLSLAASKREFEKIQF